MTAMCVAVDPSTGRASIVGAGHPPLLIARRTGATETIASVAPPLGLAESPELTETTVNLNPGDTFLLYTDGLLGSRKGKESRLSPQFLKKMLDHSAPSAEALLGRILAETAPGEAEKALPDDVAALAVRRTA
jgi:sigma-B regulation protein RsbU (phosphoserine phosphatase)